MARNTRKGVVSVRLNRNGKTLSFSTKASAPLAGYTDVDIFESIDVVAVRGTYRGSYHISKEEGRPRKALSNAQLVTYLCEKFGCSLGSSLPAWISVEEDMLFFGRAQHTGSGFLDESFTPLEVEYNRRAGDWAYVHDNWIEFTRDVRDALPERMTACHCGRVILLLGDPEGTLSLTLRRQSGNRMLVSHALADSLRSIYGGKEKGMRLRAALVPGGVALADSQEELAAVNMTRPARLVLDESQHRFMTLGQKGTIYLSASAREGLVRNGRVDVYEACGYLALRPADDGAVKVTESGYGCYLYSRELSRAITAQWPGSKRLYLLRHEGLWVLWPSTQRPMDLPPAFEFQKAAWPGTRRQELQVPPRVTAARGERAVYGR